MDTNEKQEVNFSEGEKQIHEELKKLYKLVKFEILRLNHEVECIKKCFINIHIDEITKKLDGLIDEKNDDKKT